MQLNSMGYYPHKYYTSTYNNLIVIAGSSGNVNQYWEMKYFTESFTWAYCIGYQKLQEYSEIVDALIQSRKYLSLREICLLTSGPRRHILSIENT